MRHGKSADSGTSLACVVHPEVPCTLALRASTSDVRTVTDMPSLARRIRPPQ